uniref:Uncharacterized protein n=1 Tax=Anguilla anguilla TaxID=7936 RepID=A0A0E9WEI4_ANGAN
MGRSAPTVISSLDPSGLVRNTSQLSPNSLMNCRQPPQGEMNCSCKSLAIAIALKLWYPSDTAFEMAFRSAQMPRL